MPAEVYTGAVSRLERYRSDSRIQAELDAALHNTGEEKTDYDGWLDGCGSFLDDNLSVLKGSV